MAQTTRRKPIRTGKDDPKPYAEMTETELAEARQQMYADAMEHRLSEAVVTQTEYGPVRHFEYTAAGRLFRQPELAVSQQLEITGLMIESGMNVQSFNDGVARGAESFALNVTQALASPKFLQIVLRDASGDELPDGYFERFPSEPFETLFQDVLTDFFFLNPKYMQRTTLYFGGAAQQAEQSRQIGT